MGTQADALTACFLQAANDLRTAVEGCSAAQWQATNADGVWTVAATAQHAAQHIPGILGAVLTIAGGERFAPPAMAAVDAQNVEDASALASVDKGAVLAALQQGADLVAAQLPALSDDQLAVTTQIAALQNATVSAAQFAEMALIGHLTDHLGTMLVPV